MLTIKCILDYSDGNELIDHVTNWNGEYWVDV